MKVSEPADAQPSLPAAPGGERHTILYFGNDSSGENRTSSYHVARWLARRHHVLYFECPGLRAPRSSARDLRRVLTRLRMVLAGPRATTEGLQVQTLLQVPFHRFAPIRALNRRLTSFVIRTAMRQAQVSRPISWFVVPHLASVAGRLGERLCVYYCIDDYAELPDVNAAVVRSMDEELTRKADIVFVASAELLDRKRHQNREMYLSPHGVDFDHFVRAQDPALAPPADAGAFRRPIVGFFGLIERWIDLELLSFLAGRRPEWTFLMIGRVAVPGSELPRQPNVIFPGPRPYDSLPAYGKLFDAAIIPYRLTAQVRHANPMKLREYLALGKPIVSVSTPEIDRFSDYLSIAHTHEEFLAHLDRAIQHGLDQTAVQRQTLLASGMTWEKQLRRAMELVERRLSFDAGTGHPV